MNIRDQIIERKDFPLVRPAYVVVNDIVELMTVDYIDIEDDLMIFWNEDKTVAQMKISDAKTICPFYLE